MNRISNLLLMVGSGIVGGLIVFLLLGKTNRTEIKYMPQIIESDSLGAFRIQPTNQFPEVIGIAKQASASVVQLYVSASNLTLPNDSIHAPFNLPKTSTGSGVVISPDGIIVTNYHVVKNGTDIYAYFLDKRRYKAAIVGSDASTDIAVLKIDAQNLPYLSFANSDSVKIGQWVLAIGSPFDLDFSVTAGIVSAKNRALNILRQSHRLAVESYIQTDAVVNMGNSGGALIDLNGNLIGVNSAIASNTGYYQGYSFAIPSAIVKKVTEDLMARGEVDRGLLGISIYDIDVPFALTHQLSSVSGVYVSAIESGSPADRVGIKPKDIITHIDNRPTPASTYLQEYLARLRSGQKVSIGVLRGTKALRFDVVLATAPN